MPQFDVELWKTRATARFTKACAAGVKTAGRNLHRDLAAIDALEAVIGWCASRQVDVVFSRRPNGLYESGDEKTRSRITLNGRLSPESQLFVLLHECGHHLIGDRKPNQRFGNGWHAADGAAKRTLLHRVDIIDEELEAWHRGWNLAKRLRIKVNLGRYNEARARYVKTYLQWAAKASEKRSGDG